MQESSRRTSTSLTTLKPLTGHNKLENSSRDGDIRPPYLPPEKSVCRQEATVRTKRGTTELVPNWESRMTRLYIVTLLI